MSARRKNARRLRDLRALGVPIDGDYLVTDFALRYYPASRMDLVGYGVRDQRRRVTRIDWRAQRAILAAA